MDRQGGIRIDHPGDGAWVMDRVEGAYCDALDHVILRHDGARRLGGFALCQYMGASVTSHMAGGDRPWMNRTVIWMMFDYAFNQLGCRKIIALARSDNARAIAMDLRAGFRLETVLRDVYADADMVILSMNRARCRWLDVAPRGWVSTLEQEAA